jgi:hypothetical protein
MTAFRYSEQFLITAQISKEFVCWVGSNRRTIAIKSQLVDQRWTGQEKQPDRESDRP